MKHKGISINKSVLDGYSDEQLQQWAKDNEVSAEDLKDISSKLDRVPSKSLAGNGASSNTDVVTDAKEAKGKTK